MYRGLWKIEESFNVTKSDLEARPVYVSTKDHIEAIYTCFVSLVIARILEIKLENRYSITKLLETLRKTECCYAQQNYYLFNFYDDVLADIDNALVIDYSKRIRTLGEIKKNLANTKKELLRYNFMIKIKASSPWLIRVRG